MKSFFTKLKIKKPLLIFLNVLFLEVLLVIYIIMWMNISFGWFSNNRNSNANGMNVQSAGIDTLEILATTDGSDIGVSDIINAVDKLAVDYYGSDNILFPGVGGTITFFVHNGSEKEKNDPYSFEYRISAENNKYDYPADHDIYPNGYYKDSVEENQLKVAEFLSSHLLFFTSKTDGKYSGWIKPGEGIDQTVDADKSPYKVTVYWVWIEQFNQIFDEYSDMIETETREEIADYYSRSENIGKIVLGSDLTEQAYNDADTLIGITLKHLFFKIEVFKN